MRLISKSTAVALVAATVALAPVVAQRAGPIRKRSNRTSSAAQGSRWPS